ncbi:MAG: FtsW/RodA/SpoVE family cell cycle protein [Ferruginibacter sp.]|nr:FtsW/RodA/SpoVE family cell cycle protein [Ferruginibacter sp.]
MPAVIKKNISRITERIFLLMISLVLGLVFYQVFMVLERDFPEVPKRIADGTMMNINDSRPGERIKTLLAKGFYFKDNRDIELIGAVVEKEYTLHPGLTDNTGELNKSKYNINAEDAFNKGGESFKRRVQVSRSLLGFSENDTLLFEQERTNPMKLPAVTGLAMGPYKISGSVNNNDQPVAAVLLRLRMVIPQDSISFADILEPENKIIEFKNGVRKVFVKDSANQLQLESLVAYVRSDAGGNYSFGGLPPGKAFEILPLQPGYQFGRSKGVEQLENDIAISFNQSPHTIKLFSTADFNTFKKERSFIVRTPAEAVKWFWIIACSFLGAFWLLHLLLSIRFPEADQLILPLLMLLTGFSLITLLSLQDPLRDRFLGKSTLVYFCGGFAAMLILLLFNLRRFTPDSWLYRLIIFKNNRLAANGWPWALTAMGLLALTILFGTGPEGSGVKVNLLGFQPSEIVKFLVIIFLAGFFAANEKFISGYASWEKRFSFFFFALFAIGATILLFLILGDLGPAMVCCFTFIILFSFSRGDFKEMAAAVIVYILSVWICGNVWLGTGVTIGCLLLYMLILKKKGSESAIMAMVIVCGFMLLDKIPLLASVFPGPIKRLIDRKAIWENAWNNEVFGGDQVANGIWAMSSGGFTGQGAGEGFAKTIPEAHTDMILPSFGEEFGYTGIICIFILFLLYLHRSIVIGRQTGAPFLFYLCAGIGIATFIQFLLIAGGSTGALPLTGVALPFMSYGGSSLFCNMVAAGFLLSASHLKGSSAQMKFISSRQDQNLVPALLAACVGILLLTVNVSKYIINNKKWVVEPALVADRSGERMFSYNPRINILMNRLQAGNLSDRKGKLLATSNHDFLMQQKDSLLALGISKESVESFAYKRADRYYPFGEQMFFWTGDANTGVFNGGSNGYFAEYEHGPALRGFPTPSAKFQVSASHYRENRFLPQTTTEMTVNKRDYSALSSLLLAGISSEEFRTFKNKNRDVQLTMDAALQTNIQKSIQADDSANTKRTSVVIMEDNTGDILASAAFPLPATDNWDLLTLSETELNKLPGWNVNSDIGFTHATQPGSTAKLVTALAAFNKLGEGAAKKIIVIHPQDLIRIKSDEPDEAGNISMERAIIKSNNSFFIRLANEEQLQEYMGDLYLQTGMFLHGVGGYYYQAEQNNKLQQDKWKEIWRKTEFTSLKRYNPDNIRRTRAKGISGMAWGQGELVATPASVARLAAAIANNGTMPENRFVMDINGVPSPLKKGWDIAKNQKYAELLTGYMQKQSAGKINRLGILVAGKTGTPERIYRGETINDGWYVFFAPKQNGTGHIVVCVRIENARGSSEAVKLAGKHVIPILLQRGYIKSFEAPVIKAKATPVKKPVVVNRAPPAN